MAQKKFWSDLLFVQGLNVLIKAVWILLIDRAVQDLLPKEDYGVYYQLLSLSILFVIVLDFGLNNMNSKEVATNQGYFFSNFKVFFGAKLLLSLLYLFALWVASSLMHLSQMQLTILGALALFQIINSLNQYLRSNLAAMHLFKLDGSLAVADRLLVIIICIFWLYVPGFEQYLTIKNFVFVQLTGVVLTFALAFGINIFKRKKISERARKANVFSLVRKSLPYALLITLMAIFTRVDAVMIGEMLGDGETDRYAMCYRLIDAGNMIAALFSGMLLPMFARIIFNPKEVESLASIAVKVLIIPALLGAIIFSPHAHEILSVMYPNKVSIISSDTFVVLMFSFVSSASVFVFGTLLTAANTMKILNYVALVSASLNIILNWVMIPIYGIFGAGLATLITQSVFALGCLMYSYKKFQFHVNQRLTLKIVGILGVFCLLFFGSLQFLENSFVHMSFGVSLSVLLVVGSGIISSNTLKNLSRRKTHKASDN